MHGTRAARAGSVWLPLLVATLLGGCAEAHRDGTTGTATATGPSFPPPKTVVVEISGLQYRDGSPMINAGDTVRWVHRDGDTPHTVTSAFGTPDSFESGDLDSSPPREFSFTFSYAGRYDYYCRHHDAMRAAISVTA